MRTEPCPGGAPPALPPCLTSGLEFDRWLNTPGWPPFLPDLSPGQQLMKPADELAELWAAESLNVEAIEAVDITGWKTYQLVYLLDQLLQKSPLPEGEGLAPMGGITQGPGWWPGMRGHRWAVLVQITGDGPWGYVCPRAGSTVVSPPMSASPCPRCQARAAPTRPHPALGCRGARGREDLGEQRRWLSLAGNVERLSAMYPKISKAQNAKLRLRWCQIILKNNHEPEYSKVKDFLHSQVCPVPLRGRG